MALVGDPELLILDEPSSGLDPGGAKEMREIVASEADRGATVFFSSHILGQVEAVCDHVGILQEGELVAEDSMDALRATVEHGERLVVHVDRVDDEALAGVRSLSGVETAVVADESTRADRVDSAGDDGETITVGCTASAKAEVVTTLASAGLEIRDFETESVSLESLFLSYTDEGAALGVDDGSEDGQVDSVADGGRIDVGTADGRVDERTEADR
jgi:ABC-2 type transport system ATP-binding protein